MLIGRISSPLLTMFCESSKQYPVMVFEIISTFFLLSLSLSICNDNTKIAHRKRVEIIIIIETNFEIIHLTRG